MFKHTILGTLAALFLFTASVRAESKIEVKQLHMCCSGCAEEVENILKKVDGISDVQVTKKTRTATFTAPNSAAAQKAIDALADDGFHGEVSDKAIGFKADSGAKKEKVTSLTVSGFHNTCPGCVKSFRVALKKVSGVESDDCKPNVTTCTVKGNFNAAELVEALNKEGFHVKVK
ncbi:MAG: cation transporter [Planctomycetia bacterium]|nr:cation transporter [Planctomycetia bacterium]